MGMNDQTTPAQAELYGHPTGLFTLFFAEMWERFSYYGMRALLVFYMIKSFGFADSDAYAIYGAYTALVYMTPFFGGMIADRLLGQRSAVLLGGSLMAAGHLVMTVEYQWAFYIALGLLIVGNGFFKPNISTIVGKIYRPGDARRDGGFTIFYMGINLGAALAPLICGYVGETFGWHWGFGLATVGMLIGLAVFWAPPKVAQALILGGAIFTAFLMIVVVRDKDWLFRIIYSAMALALVASGWVAFRAVGLGGIPRHLGLAPNPEALKKPVFAGISARNAVFLGTLLTVPIFALLVSRGRHDGFIAPETIKGFMDGNIFLATIGILLKEV
ncbi:MAG: peptide MFS transporter, partial [Planctomycetes bacterium]|nr:peptide MFS transporter [Planctomycetota bacterium]